MLSAEQVEKYVDDSRKEARMALDYLLSRCPDSTGRRRVHLVQGEAADSIVEFTREHAIDLVVMGTTSRTGMPALLIGNTAESILQRLDCSVLAAKPDGFASRVV
jgi:nucleotide-binding universal stress UspA family protein